MLKTMQCTQEMTDWHTDPDTDKLLMMMMMMMRKMRKLQKDLRKQNKTKIDKYFDKLL